jgi:hypothetical protein
VKRSLLTLCVGLALAGFGPAAHARAGHRTGRASARGARARTNGSGQLVAVQPFEGTNGAPLRALVSRIVRGRGFHAVMSLPHYEGTAQYPDVARDNHLAAFVTGDVEERGKWSSITFLVWNGMSGSVIGRWTAAAPTTVIGQAVGKGFWQHLGPAVLRAQPPPLPIERDQAPTMRIDASDSMRDEPIATRE